MSGKSQDQGGWRSLSRRRAIPAEPVAYANLVAAVRRFKASELLAECAAINAHFSEVELDKIPLDRRLRKSSRWLKDFVIAGVAHATLSHGTEHRSRTLTLRDFVEIAWTEFNVEHPETHDDDETREVNRMVERVAYEQFASQQSVFENVARTISLLLDHADAHLDTPTPEQWRDAIGCELEQFLRLGFALRSEICRQGGRLSQDFVSSENFLRLLSPLSADSAHDLVVRWFADSIEQMRVRSVETEIPGLEKWSPNPLLARPLVDMLDGSWICPWPWAVINRISANGMYYVGLEAFGPSSFPRALGYMFESYVGTHLRLLEFATVEEQFKYPVGRNEKDSVDYFIVTPEAVILVEVKSNRPVASSRAGLGGDGPDDVVVKLNKAYRQIERSWQAICSEAPGFEAIPSDRPIVAMVVTLEPFNMVNTVFAHDELKRPGIPVAVVSALELESAMGTLATVPDAGRRILESISATVLGSPLPTLEHACDGLIHVRNPVLEEVSNRFFEPWDAMIAAGGATSGSESTTEPEENLGSTRES